MILILLSGWAGAGKDATAYLLNNYGFKRYAFADELKRQVAQEYKFPLQWCYTQSGKQQRLDTADGKTVRDILIFRGQQIRAEKGKPGYFAEITAERILDGLCDKVVISDWRLLCELQTLKEFFFMNTKLVTVRVKRTGQTESFVKDSLTEHELDDFPFDIVLENPGSSLQGLHNEIRKKLADVIGEEEFTSPV